MVDKVPQLAQDQELVQSVLQFLETIHQVFATSNASAWVSDIKIKVGDLNSADINTVNKAMALFALEDAGYLSMVESQTDIQFRYKELLIFFDKSPSERVSYYQKYITEYK